MLNLFNFRRKKRLRKVFLGSGSYFILIPSYYLVEHDDNELTILIYPKGTECITLRFDVLSLESKDNIQGKNGFDYVLDSSDMEKKEISIVNELAISYYETKSTEENTLLIMKFWEIGPKDETLIIVSATILDSEKNEKRVIKLLELLPDIFKSIQPSETENTISMPWGVLNYSTMHNVEGNNYKFFELNNIDKQFLNDWVKNGLNIIKYYDSVSNPEIVSIDKLDFIYKNWIIDKGTERFNNESIINGLAIIFGELLIKEFNLKWYKVIDNYGETFVVRSKNNIVAFPLSSIKQRIQTDETAFFSSIYYLLKHKIIG